MEGNGRVNVEQPGRVVQFRRVWAQVAVGVLRVTGSGKDKGIDTGRLVRVDERGFRG